MMAVALRSRSMVLRAAEIPLRRQYRNHVPTRWAAVLLSTTTDASRETHSESNAASSRQKDTPKVPPQLPSSVDDEPDVFYEPYRHLEGVMAKYSQRLDSVIYPYVLPRKMILAQDKVGTGKTAELAKEDRSGLLKSLQLLNAHKKGGLESAERLLLEYWLLLDVHRPNNSKDAIERANAILADDDAAVLVSQWIKRNYIHGCIGESLLSDISGRRCLSIAIHILVGAGEWKILRQWFHETSKQPIKGDRVVNKRLQLKYPLFTGTAEAIRLWEPEGASTQSWRFLKGSMEHLRKDMDIAPLVKRAFDEHHRVAPVHKYEHIQRMLTVSGCSLAEMSGALELQIAVLDMCQAGRLSSPTPWEFQNLVKEVHSNGCHPLRIQYQPPEMTLRIRTLAKRCAGLLWEHGKGGEAKDVMRMTKEVYGS
ncbi:hypothetical protein PG984_006968 [Apiospora sp. TS-2023a]